MSETRTDRPLLTRQQVEALRIRLVKHQTTVAGTADWHEFRDALDTLIAAFAELDAVDDFAQEPDEGGVPTSNTYLDGLADGRASGRNGLRRELRALRGIEA